MTRKAQHHNLLKKLLHGRKQIRFHCLKYLNFWINSWKIRNSWIFKAQILKATLFSAASKRFLLFCNSPRFSALQFHMRANRNLKFEYNIRLENLIFCIFLWVCQYNYQYPRLQFKWIQKRKSKSKFAHLLSG